MTQLPFIHESAESYLVTNEEYLTEPERELRSFVHAMASLVGPGAIRQLTELWLDELACLDCVPGPMGPNWRLVSLSASMKLASLVIASQLSAPCI
jgi:hypothetical protein